MEEDLIMCFGGFVVDVRVLPYMLCKREKE